MTTLIFGGSFDPVHNGHINAVKTMLADKSLNVDRAIIIPTYISPFKLEGASISCEDRLAMTKLAFGEIESCTVSDMEINANTVSYTSDTLERLHKLYPDDTLILAVGSDSIATLDRWHCYEKILSLSKIAVLSRENEDSDIIISSIDKITKDGGRVYHVKTEPIVVSSTLIRKKILNNEDISCYIPKNVVKNIVEHKLYMG